MGDPVFSHGLNLAVWVILLVKTVAVFVIVLVSVLFMVMYERKAVARLGVRYGPNRAGPNGWLQSLADGTKLLFKEALTPRAADKFIYKAAPYLMLVPLLLVFSIVPIGGTITVAGHTTRLQLADPPWGILFLLMCSGVAVYGVMLAGWASGSKYPLLGSVRASAQLVSYEAVLGLTAVTVVLVTGSLRTSAIVAAQHGGFLNHWNFLRTLIIPFILFSIAITAEMTRPPFDLVEAEEELSGGYNMEYSSIDFAWFYLAEYAALVTNSAIIVTLWFGGYDGPKIAGHSIGPFWFALKVLIILYIYVWIRATLPRLRYDQLMELGWKRLIPAALAMLMIVAGRQISYGWGLVAFGVAVVLFAVLLRAIDVGRGATEIEGAQNDRMARGTERDIAVSFVDFFKGFIVTGKLPFKPKVTTLYPEQKRPKPERFHGRHVLNRYEDGMEKCIGCELCAGVCPARCIYVRGADNPPDAPVSPGERYGFVYEINFLRCIHCDLCVEACPTEAITESKLFEFSFTNRDDAIYTKAELLVDDEGRPQQLPWEDWKAGDDRNTSGWVRATSPAGSAASEGQPLWSGELGYGVRPAQKGQSDPGAADVPAETDLSLREMVSGALRGIGVNGTRPTRGAGEEPR